MSDTIALFTKAEIGPDDFADVLRSLGGGLDEDSDVRGFVARNGRNVWPMLSSEELSSFPEEMLAEIARELDGLPKSNVVIEIGHDAGSKTLAFEVARAFARRWPAVAHDLQVPGRLYTVDELSGPVKL